MIDFRWFLSQVTTHEIHWYVMGVFCKPFEVESNAKTLAFGDKANLDLRH